MLLHLYSCFCSGLQVASSKQQQHAAHRSGCSTASICHPSCHSSSCPPCLHLFIMLLHLSSCFCPGLQVASSKQQQHAAHRGGCSTASICHPSCHSSSCPPCLHLFIMLLHLSSCFCPGLQVASSKQQQHAAHRGGSNTASSGHRSGHSPPNPGGCESAVPAQRPSCSPAAHVVQDAWEDHRSACHRLDCSAECRNITFMCL